MKLYAAVALFGLAAIKASPIPDGLFDNADLDDCEDIIEPAELPDIAAPFMDIQAEDEQPDCEGEAIEEETILDIAPAFQLDSEAYDAGEECEDEIVTEAPPVILKDEPEPEEPPCYDEDESNEAVEPINTNTGAVMKDEQQFGVNPLNYDDYDDGYDDY